MNKQKKINRQAMEIFKLAFGFNNKEVVFKKLSLTSM